MKIIINDIFEILLIFSLIEFNYLFSSSTFGSLIYSIIEFAVEFFPSLRIIIYPSPYLITLFSKRQDPISNIFGSISPVTNDSSAVIILSIFSITTPSATKVSPAVNLIMSPTNS